MLAVFTLLSYVDIDGRDKEGREREVEGKDGEGEAVGGRSFAPKRFPGFREFGPEEGMGAL